MALLAAPQDPGAKEEPDPIAAADAAERKRDREFAGPGSAAVQTLDVGAAPVSPTPAYKPPPVRPFEMPAYPRWTGATPSESAPPAAAVTVERYSRSYEGPKTEVEQVYEAGVKSAAARAQARLGPLDGMWTLTREDGSPLYVVAFADDGAGAAEAAWRDLRKRPGPGAVGAASSVAREGDDLTIRFYPQGAALQSVLRLRSDRGRWRGTLDEGASAPFSVVMTRP